MNSQGTSRPAVVHGAYTALVLLDVYRGTVVAVCARCPCAPEPCVLYSGVGCHRAHGHAHDAMGGSSRRRQIARRHAGTRAE